MASNVPKNLRYDQTSQSTLAEFLVATQAPEGKSSFKHGEKIDFRFTMTGGYVTSWASSSFDFDLVVNTTTPTSGLTHNDTYAAAFDPYLGAHQLIERITVTVGGNIIEDYRNYAQIYKTQRAMHSNQNRRFLDVLGSEDESCLMSTSWANGQPGEAVCYKAINSVSVPNPVAVTTETKRLHCRLNLLSCLGTLAGAKYWPNVLLNSDVRLEIYLQSNPNEGMIMPLTHEVGKNDWSLENVKYTLSNVRLNSTVINAIKSTGSVSMIMPGYTTVTNTLIAPTSTTDYTFDNLKYSSSASSLKQLLLVFRRSSDIGVAARNSYAFVEPMGLTSQFLIGSQLMPARPVTMITERFREFMRCIGGPANSLEQKTLIRPANWLHPPTTGTEMTFGKISESTSLTSFQSKVSPCHILGQSLEMYADHTLSSVVFSGINAVNLIMQAQLSRKKVTSKTDLRYETPGTQVTNDTQMVCDTIMIYDRLLEFKGGEVVMGY